MKLVIQTQYAENYGDANKPYWKFKGGETYIVENLNPNQAERILRDGIPTLKALIEFKNPMAEECVTDYRIVEDDLVVCESWETPVVLSWKNNTWVARTVMTGDEAMLRKPVISKITKWTMNMNGEKADLAVSYEVEGGQVFDYKEIYSYLENYDKA